MKPVIRPSTWRRRARSKGALTAKVGETVRLFLVDLNYFRGHEKGTIGALDVSGADVPAVFSASTGSALAGH